MKKGVTYSLEIQSSTDLETKEYNQRNGTQVQLYSLSWRGAVAHYFTLTTQSTQQRCEPDLGPGAAFLMEYHRGMIAVVRQDSRNATIKTHVNKAQAAHGGPWTCLVFHSSVDLERFFRAMRCFSSSLFFSALANSRTVGMHVETQPPAQKIFQILLKCEADKLPRSPFSSARMSGLSRLSVGGTTPSVLFSSSFSCIANVENA